MQILAFKIQKVWEGREIFDANLQRTLVNIFAKLLVVLTGLNDPR